MKLGLIGLASSGKTVIFNALTGREEATDAFHANEPNIAIVEVFDARINFLSEKYQPKKSLYATIELIDFVWKEDEDKRGQLDLTQMKLLDSLAIVLRNFNDPLTDETLVKPQPIKDLKHIETELLISDLLITEKRLEKLVLNSKRGVKSAESLLEEKVLEKIIDFLHQGKPVREMDLSGTEEKIIRGFQLLTNKPILLIVNSDDRNFGKNNDMLESLRQDGYEVEEIAGLYEMELKNLDKEDRAVFMRELGIESEVKDRIISAAYRVLGYISFFTVGPDEVRAWTITSGENAQKAAGKIHSDLEKGFIRAECFTYDDFVEFGSEKVLKEKGKIRLEGKTYQVKDGDILFIRFSK
jgi:ribosome-binding ATPase